ncbi:uncharacterized protein JCM6883_006706 [Sporobolomyces salmoneus]|uniref:uncharacterized protein n=1 Tax=Sporobolomyces salmoneus TaxID=183962 RepID=UPI003179797E
MSPKDLLISPASLRHLRSFASTLALPDDEKAKLYLAGRLAIRPENVPIFLSSSSVLTLPRSATSRRTATTTRDRKNQTVVEDPLSLEAAPHDRAPRGNPLNPQTCPSGSHAFKQDPAATTGTNDATTSTSRIDKLSHTQLGSEYDFDEIDEPMQIEASDSKYLSKAEMNEIPFDHTQIARRLDERPENQIPSSSNRCSINIDDSLRRYENFASLLESLQPASHAINRIVEQTEPTQNDPNGHNNELGNDFAAPRTSANFDLSGNTSSITVANQVNKKRPGELGEMDEKRKKFKGADDYSRGVIVPSENRVTRIDEVKYHNISYNRGEYMHEAFARKIVMKVKADLSLSDRVIVDRLRTCALSSFRHDPYSEDSAFSPNYSPPRQ